MQNFPIVRLSSKIGRLSPIDDVKLPIFAGGPVVREVLHPPPPMWGA
jgi:hypothetical protein